MFGQVRDFFKEKNTGAYSIQGRKPSQEDSFFISEKRKEMQLIFVADGVGGHGHGDFASQLCVEMYNQAFNKSQTINLIPVFLQQTALEVAKAVLEKSKIDATYKNCGTTLSGFFIENENYYTINIGDSRVYLFSEGKLLRQTKDHSQVQQLIDNNIISEEEAFTHPKRNMMTSAIGQSLSMIKVDVSQKKNLKRGDILVACTDGVHDALRDTEIERFLKNNATAEELAKILVKEAFDAGSKDNITVCVYRHN